MLLLFCFVFFFQKRESTHTSLRLIFSAQRFSRSPILIGWGQQSFNKILNEYKVGISNSSGSRINKFHGLKIVYTHINTSHNIWSENISHTHKHQSWYFNLCKNCSKILIAVYANTATNHALAYANALSGTFVWVKNLALMRATWRNLNCWNRPT